MSVLRLAIALVLIGVPLISQAPAPKRLLAIGDVRRRKLCIAHGERVVHGIQYSHSRQFGITLKSIKR